MPQKPYKPDSDEGVALMLSSFDDNISAYASKYGITANEMLRVKQARLGWRWFLDDLEFGRQWTESVTSKKNQMDIGPGGASQNMPVGPVQPSVPTINWGAGPVAILWEPDFFAFFGSLVARIKAHQDYLKAEGDILGIEGAEIPPPSQQIIPNLKLILGPGGKPQLDVPKLAFDGYDMEYRINDGPVLAGPFVNTRRFVHNITLPGPNQSALYQYRVQYRYKGQPFGQWSAWKSIPVQG